MTTQLNQANFAVCSGFACAPGFEILAWLRGEGNRPIEPEDYRSEDNPERLTFSLVAESRGAAFIQENRVIRVEYPDAQPFEEWTIAQIKLTRHGASSRMLVTCTPPIDWLTDAGPVEADIATLDGSPPLADGVAQTTLTDLLQAKLVDNTKLAAVLPFPIDLGDIDPTIEIDLEWSDATAAAIVNAGVQEVQTRSQQPYLWDLIRDTAAYKIQVKAA